MALALDCLVPGVLLSDTAISVYGPATTRAQLDAVTFTNNGEVEANVSIWMPSGGGPSDQNRILRNFVVPTGKTALAFELRGHVIRAGMEFFAVSSEPGVVALFMSARTQS